METRKLREMRARQIDFERMGGETVISNRWFWQDVNAVAAVENLGGPHNSRSLRRVMRHVGRNRLGHCGSPTECVKTTPNLNYTPDAANGTLSGTVPHLTDQSFQVTLSSPAGAKLGAPRITTVTIVDLD